MIYRVVVRESQKVVYRVKAESADEAREIYEGWGIWSVLCQWTTR